MTTSEGGLPRSRHELDASGTGAGSSEAQSNGPRRSSPTLEHRLSNVVDVQDPVRILDCSRLERQRRFQYIVRHYLSQILYGCKSVYCDTSTCLSRNKRDPPKPYRRPTQLTARALAHYLASQPNPHRGLCPHELKVSPSSLELEVPLEMNIAGDLNGDTYPARSGQASKTQHALARAIDGRHQIKKDTKSIGQNMFDSVSLIYSYSRLLPSPLQALDALRTSSHDMRHDQCKRTANDLDATTHTNGAAGMTRQYSQQTLRAQSQTHAARDLPQLLSNGQEVHKVPYHRPTTTEIHPTKKTPIAALDNASEVPKMSISRTGRKSFTLGGSILPPMAKPKVTPTPVPSQPKVTKPKKDNCVAVPITRNLSCDILEHLRNETHRVTQENGLAMDTASDHNASQRSASTEAFINRSLFYSLSNAETLLQSFHDSRQSFEGSPLPHLNSSRLIHSFRGWKQRSGTLIFDSLSIAVEALFIRPPTLRTHAAVATKSSPSGTSTDGFSGKHEFTNHPRYLSTREVAHIVMICIHALTSSVPVSWSHSWAQLRSLRSWGVVVPVATTNTDKFVDPYISIIDALEYEPAVRLADRLLQGIGVRLCFEHILAMQKNATPSAFETSSEEDDLLTTLVRHLEVIEHVALDSKRKMKALSTTDKEPGWTVTAVLIEWLKTVIMKKWNGDVKINKWSSVATAIMLLHELHDQQRRLNVWSRMFRIPYLHEHMNAVTDPVDYLDWTPQLNVLHILQYPELHPTDYLVKFFRIINLTSMMAQYDHTQHTQQMLRQLDTILREPYLYMIKHRLKVALNDYLVLDVSREQPLKDTLDQLWRQERKLLLKPLKIKLGQQEGEVGLDHGGVTYEFFRVVLGEAFAPDYGMFTIDTKTQMTWFKPGTLEPLWKFKILGVLFSLAIYNGITLPVNFPLAFYNLMLNSRFKFVDDHSSIDYIRDGWPDLAKSFETLLDWKDGNVADVFMRDYVFSYEAFGQNYDIDMAKRENETSSSVETHMVTNENRGAFVRDYVTHLILHSIRPQLKAFKKGFHTCLSPRSLKLFTPETLKKLVEGTQTISIDELRACATYEDYDATHPTVKMFWEIVQGYSQDDATRLLEFVTASDRIPVTGYKSLTFNIVRMGNDSEQLPTSSTCFGKLYLPEYKDKGKMKRKLELAIQNAKGFGVV